MVFDNDEDGATTFFKSLIYKHVNVYLQGRGVQVDGADTLVAMSFTQISAFKEFVRAAEGVPRDAINILSLAAQSSSQAQLSVQIVRAAARTWYQRDKGRAITNPVELSLLSWIIDNVLGQRRARAFLVRADVRHPNLDSLFDNRVLHLLKRSISTQDQPGMRYDVYKIDYGAYVELLTTHRAPLGLLPTDENDYLEVPPDDYRAIRRAILDLNHFDTSQMRQSRK
jgi:hypothetical protein